MPLLSCGDNARDASAPALGGHLGHPKNTEQRPRRGFAIAADVPPWPLAGMVGTGELTRGRLLATLGLADAVCWRTWLREIRKVISARVAGVFKMSF